MRWPGIITASCIASAAAAAEQPAPPLNFDAGTVLAGGYVLSEPLHLSPQPGQVYINVRDGSPLRWRIEVEGGETRLLQPDGRWAAKAEYSRTERNGRTVCLIYQTYLSPEWAIKGLQRPTGRADFIPADDRIYAFRETPCP
jgi:hypothetical protein